MGTGKMRIGILSSSRADYGIYLPLIEALCPDASFRLELICFGTHLSKFHGYTLKDIDQSKFAKIHVVENIIANDSPNAIASSFGLTALKFADFWQNNEFDIVFCLGDRFEMAAAVLAALPYGVKFAHLHGGETTLGAIDNVYRHTITLASKVHFVATEKNGERIRELIGSGENIFHVGSLSLDNLKKIELLSKNEFFEKWQIDLNKKTILITVHPETVDFSKNEGFSEEIHKTLCLLAPQRQLVITMPNADTSGMVFRNQFLKLQEQFPKQVVLIENFGTQSYFTCMKYAEILLGNSSSGIIEAASFGKYVIDIGDRQKGREAGENIIHVPFEANTIYETCVAYMDTTYSGKNIYDNGGAVDRIINFLKIENDKLR